MHRTIIGLIIFLFFNQILNGQQKRTIPKKVVNSTFINPMLNIKDDPNLVKFIQFKKDTPVYTPKFFYIQKIEDRSKTNDTIGFILQPKSGNPQKVSIKGGTLNALREYFNFKITKDSLKYPLVFVLNSISISEVKNKDYREGIYKYAYSFEYRYEDKTLNLGSGDGRYTYTTHISQKRQLDSIIAKSFVHNLNEIDTNFSEAINSHPAFCKGVNTNISYKTYNLANSDTLFYDGQHDIMWEDFTSSSSGADNYFLPRFGILFKPQIDYKNGKIQIMAKTGTYFIKSQSWVGKKIKNMPLLYHIQYQFKLAWLETIRLKKKIENGTFSCDNYETEIRQLFENSQKQLLHIFDEYSEQTKTGADRKEQNRWQAFIDNQIEEYEKNK